MSESSHEQRHDVARAAKQARALIAWYWSEGSRRAERPAGSIQWEGNYDQFALPTGTWLRELYEVRDGLDTVQAAASAPRPSVALWGMSQTGKSTSVSALIDAKVQVAPIPADPQVVSADQRARDGVGGGLHWQGGLPFFFIAPFRDTERGEEYPPHWYERSLNPFNSGLDASSCLSRFVPGTQTPRPGFTLVTDPLHPVQVQLVPPSDLLHALARGFDSECLGAALKGKQREWTPDRFDRMLAEFRDKHRAATNAAPDRKAYEQMLAVVTTLDDLVFGRVETFAKLRTTQADWQSRLESLLSDNILVGDPKIADEFAALLFWNGSTIFTERYNAMRALYETLGRAWGDRPVYASLPITSLLLDMQSCVNAFADRQKPDTREGKQQALIEGLGYKIAGDRVLLGSGADYRANPLGANAEQFANFQGLVWELVIPLNMENLVPGPFRELLETADLLDFPGVGRDEKNETNRLNAHPALFPNASADQQCRPQRFYSDIVKRGKTASIVATYSRRLTIDSFSILQNIDKDEPSNHATDQLTNGIRTWLRNMAPGFTEGAGQPPEGVALNLGLTFWGEFVDQSKPDRAANFEMRRKFYGKLGVISDPEVATVFALNYHWIKSPRVKFTQPFKVGAPLYDRVLGEPEFQRIFRKPVSRESLEVMTADLERGGSGGADFMFGQLRQQVVSRPPTERAARFAPVVERLATTLDSLLGWRHLRAPHGEHDTRIEELDAFTSRLRAAIESGSDREVRVASHALRELVNVDPEGLSLPTSGRDGLTSAFVEKVFNEWKNRQVQRYDEWLRGGEQDEPRWSSLGVRDRSDIDRMLDALITSLGRKTLADIAALALRCWETIPGRDEHRQQHLRRYLALEMTNRLVYKSPEKRSLGAPRAAAGNRRNGSAMGAETPAYAAFIGPFVEQQIGAIKRHLTPVVLRPPLHGDQQLEKILSASAS